MEKFGPQTYITAYVHAVRNEEPDVVEPKDGQHRGKQETRGEILDNLGERNMILGQGMGWLRGLIRGLKELNLCFERSGLSYNGRFET